jgi:hypothetical protein
LKSFLLLSLRIALNWKALKKNSLSFLNAAEPLPCRQKSSNVPVIGTCSFNMVVGMMILFAEV